MVFQHFNLFTHFNAVQNVCAGLRFAHSYSRRDAEDEAVRLLQMVGLGDKIHAYPANLSGGQQQRVAIARAMAGTPQVILLDEPTSALDPELVGEVLEVVQRLAQLGVTMVIATHEIQFASEVADWIHFMSDGVIVESGPGDALVRDPQEARTQRFLSRVARPSAEERRSELA